MKRSLGAVVIVSVLTSLAPFLVGALAAFIRQEIDFTSAQLGTAVSLYYSAAAASSLFGGRLCEYMGPFRSMTCALVVCSLSLVGIGWAARTWTDVVLYLMLAGVGNALGKSSTNLALARAIPHGRQGLAFGLKQASVPGATLLAGVAVPLAASAGPDGWRYFFSATAAGIVLFFVLLDSNSVLRVRSSRRVRPVVRDRDTTRRWLLMMTCATAFGSGAITVLGIFYAGFVMSSGGGAAAVGLWLGIGSVLGLASRIIWGMLADRHTAMTLRWVAVLMGTGAVGAACFGFGGDALTLSLGTILAFGGGMGWNGLFHFSVVSRNPSAPAMASSFTNVGMYLGCIAAPFIFGLVLQEVGYGAAWSFLAVAFAIGAVLVLLTDWGERVHHGRAA